MRRLDDQIGALGRRQCTALLLGESGTGKELVARLIHHRSPRAGKPFVPVDCTTLRDTLLESQLFGHARGAFTGADRSTLGFYRAADGGTLFLDEVGELPLPAQAKLLRCIQEGTVTPLGAVEPIRVNVRIIAATHRDLPAMVQRGEFREDLFYRLNVACIRLPPLRERREDIPLLVEHALRELSRLYDEPVRAIAPDAMRALLEHDWPGNVRQLINAIEHALVFTDKSDIITLDDLPEEVSHPPAKNATSDRVFRLAADEPLPTLEAVERELIAAALRASSGYATRAARMLAIERHRLRRRIVHHGLTDLVRH
jgi:two-component system NtrC family response regulator